MKGNRRASSLRVRFINLKILARQNRNNPTQAESLFWNTVIRRKLTGYRFLRQKVLDKYIVDFYCPKLKLGIELDGSSHENKQDSDFKRDRNLESNNVKIIRYSNDLIKSNLEGVYYHLLEKLKERKEELNK